MGFLNIAFIHLEKFDGVGGIAVLCIIGCLGTIPQVVDNPNLQALPDLS